jgi:hypothetical protein
MKYSYQNSTLILSLALIGAALFIGCEQAPPAKNPATVSPSPNQTPATAEDVQRETAEAAQATKEYLGEKKDEFVEATNRKLADLDAKLADMKVDGEKLSGEAKVKWEAAMEDLKVKRAEMSVKLEELKKSSGAAWEDLKAGLEKAGEEVDSAVEDAVKKFKETTAEESPETTTKPDETTTNPE